MGERLAANLGGISAAVKLAGETGASLSWIPRRAGERGALDAGALAGVLPGGRPITDSGARAEVAAAWGIDEADLPAEPGLQAAGIIEALLTPPVVDEEPAPGLRKTTRSSSLRPPSSLQQRPTMSPATRQMQPPRIRTLKPSLRSRNRESPAWSLAASRSTTCRIREAFRLALKEADVVISLRLVWRASMPTLTSSSRFRSTLNAVVQGVNWEGRIRPFGRVLRDATTLTDGRVLAMIADELDRPIATEDSNAIRREIDGLGFYSGTRTSAASSNCTRCRNAGIRAGTARELAALCSIWASCRQASNTLLRHSVHRSCDCRPPLPQESGSPMPKT